jgi:hypothetical protein
MHYSIWRRNFVPYLTTSHEHSGKNATEASIKIRLRVAFTRSRESGTGTTYLALVIYDQDD